MDFWGDPAALLLAGHLIHAERSRLRRKLLFILAKYLEVPFLRFGYRVTKGDRPAWRKNRVLRLLYEKALLSPLARHGDTGHPMITADVLDLLDRQDAAVAIGPCRCCAAHGQCQAPLDTDLVIRTGVEAFTAAFPEAFRVIDRTEAKRLIQSFADAGFFHMVFVHCPTARGVHEYAVCNCRRDGCVIYLLNREFGQRGFPLLRGEHVAVAHPEQCRDCGECRKVCPWEAPRPRDGKTTINPDRCFGCGLCARACPNGAIELRRERPRPPLMTDRIS